MRGKHKKIKRLGSNNIAHKHKEDRFLHGHGHIYISLIIILILCLALMISCKKKRKNAEKTSRVSFGAEERQFGQGFEGVRGRERLQCFPCFLQVFW